MNQKSSCKRYRKYADDLYAYLNLTLQQFQVKIFSIIYFKCQFLAVAKCHKVGQSQVVCSSNFIG